MEAETQSLSSVARTGRGVSDVTNHRTRRLGVVDEVERTSVVSTGIPDVCQVLEHQQGAGGVREVARHHEPTELRDGLDHGSGSLQWGRGAPGSAGEQGEPPRDRILLYALTRTRNRKSALVRSSVFPPVPVVVATGERADYLQEFSRVWGGMLHLINILTQRVYKFSAERRRYARFRAMHCWILVALPALCNNKWWIG